MVKKKINYVIIFTYGNEENSMSKPTTRVRDSRTGKYVPSKRAITDPSHTVKEAIPKKKK
jgi:hypothetical protein